jgi:succinate dehydrogenase / fumarate reductase flavoprotein subunit
MTTTSTTDILVIGGGLAAVSAAIAAAETGADVIIANKGITGKAGSSSKAAGILAAPFGHGGLDQHPVADSPDHHAADSLAVGHNMGAPDLVKLMTENACAAVRWLQDYGVTFSQKDTGHFVQLNAPGNSRPRACSAIGGGAAIMAVMRTAAQRLGVRFFDQMTAYDLRKHRQQVVGAALYDSNATTHQIAAKSVILCAGGATGLFPTVSGDQDNVGNGLILGLQAGAALGNLEFVEYTLIYRVKGRLLRIAGLAPFMSRGAVLLNDHGENLMARYFAKTPSAQIGRAEILRVVQQEIIAGRGPVWLDCTQFSQAVWAEFEDSQGDVVLRKITDAGGDYRTEKIEVVPAAHSVLAGLVIDTNAATTVPGLFAAGENVTGIHGAGRLSGNGLTACVVLGRIAGKNASAFAAHTSLAIAPPTDAAATARLAPKRRAALIAAMRAAAGGGLGVIRNHTGIAAAHSVFSEIRDTLGPVDRLHPADRDIAQMAMLGLLMCVAAMQRPESRGVQCRDDAPALHADWTKWQIVTKMNPNTAPHKHPNEFIWTTRAVG